MVTPAPTTPTPKTPAPKPPLPQQPDPTETASWLQAQANARQNYGQMLTNLDYQQRQAQSNYTSQVAQLGQAQTQQRHVFDDPYVSRGFFRSGVRTGDLGNWWTGQQQQLQGLGNTFLNTMGSIGQQALSGVGQYGSSYLNTYAQEIARRAQLAAQIKGIQ